MNPATTLDNHNPPATTKCCLKPSPKCREKSDTPHPHSPSGRGLGDRRRRKTEPSHAAGNTPQRR